jgi:hypothetical protein
VISVAKQGLENPPVMPAFYEVMAKAWTQSDTAPDPQQFGVLLSGVRRYPGNLNLVFSVAQAGVLHGYHQEARLLINHGLDGAPSPEVRAPFERLSKRLEARQANAPAVPAPVSAPASP